ncbi:MAG: M28 family peptidase [Promethearchaeota archaeon]
MEEFAAALEFWRSFSFPRATGTSGDGLAQDLIREAFGGVPGVVVGEQEFRASRVYMNVVLNLVHPVVGALVLADFLLVVAHSFLAALVLTCALLPVSLFSRQITRALQFRVQRLGEQVPARNIWATLEPRSGAEQTLVVVAHYDSISHVLHPLVEGFGYLAGFLGGTLFSVHALAYLVPVVFFSASPGTFLQLTWGLPLAVAALLELANRKGNESDGAIDNASGVASNIYLALRLSALPLERTRVVLLLSAAEEWGDYGAHQFLEANPLELSPASTKFVVVDSIGTEGGDQLIRGSGFRARAWSPYLEELARRAMLETGAPVKPFTIPPLLQVSSDHIPVQGAGFEFTWFAGKSFAFHSWDDDASRLHEGNYRATCRCIEALVRKVDAHPWIQCSDLDGLPLAGAQVDRLDD